MAVSRLSIGKFLELVSTRFITFSVGIMDAGAG